MQGMGVGAQEVVAGWEGICTGSPLTSPSVAARR